MRNSVYRYAAADDVNRNRGTTPMTNVAYSPSDAETYRPDLLPDNNPPPGYPSNPDDRKVRFQAFLFLVLVFMALHKSAFNF